MTKKEAAYDLLKKGASGTRIAKTLRIGTSTVGKYKKQLLEDGWDGVPEKWMCLDEIIKIYQRMEFEDEETARRKRREKEFIDLYEQGYSLAEIAKKLKCAKCTAYKIRDSVEEKLRQIDYDDEIPKEKVQEYKREWEQNVNRIREKVGLARIGTYDVNVTPQESWWDLC